MSSITTAPVFSTIFIETRADLERLWTHVARGGFEYVVLDTETNHKSEKRALLVGIGLAFTDSEAFYIPVRDQNLALLWNDDDYKYVRQLLEWICERHKIIGHNLVYDALVIENNLGFDIVPRIHADTILMKHALDEEIPFGLKEVSVRYLGPWADKAQERLYESIKRNGGSTTKDNLEMYKADRDVLGEYCCYDVLLTRRLFDLFEPRLIAEGIHDYFYRDETMPLYREVTIPMKRRGFRIDRPHFERLKVEIRTEIERFEDQVQNTLRPEVRPFIERLLEDHHPVSRRGNFPKVAADHLNIQLPTDKKTGKVSLAAKGLLAHRAAVQLSTSGMGYNKELAYYDWLLEDDRDFPFDPVPIQEKLFFSTAANEGKRYVFNLNSADHLRWLFFTHLGMKPIKTTESGEPSVDAETLEAMNGRHTFCDTIIDFKKLNKLEGTYIHGILDREIDGYIYASMLQFGTTSGRFSSRDPNLQNLPRCKGDDSDLSPLVLKFTNAIKAGFVAPDGYCILNADYSSLEPVCFAHASGDEKLRDVFRQGYDLYSSIAINVFGMHEYSADKKAPNYLGKHAKEARQKAKLFCLAVVYGAEAGRISNAMEVSYQEAQEIIDAYLNAYPGLRDYMRKCNQDAVYNGYVKNSFGRIRHLPRAKQLWERYGKNLLNRRWAKNEGLLDYRYELKNLLNNAKNAPIQSVAGNIINRAMIATVRTFKERNIDGWIAMMVHDEITCVVRKEHADSGKEILRKCMVETTTISVPLGAEPLIAETWAEAK